MTFCPRKSYNADMIRRNAALSVFVAAWLLLFNYETLRYRHLCPLTGLNLPKCPLLFPPAGWIMFYSVDRRYGFAEVYGLQAGVPRLIDPHAIFETHNLGYDNIRRNVLVSVLDERLAPAFCPYLRRKFPAYEDFLVVAAAYPDLIATPDRLLRQPLYRCR